MSVRRLNRPPVVVLTGVENAGKSTLSAALSAALGWPLLEEAARTDAAVVEGRTTPEDLKRLLSGFRDTLGALLGQGAPGILCDTGALVLEMWSETAFDTALPGAASLQSQTDLHLLCRTLPHWEADPLRSMPELAARQQLEAQYVRRLDDRKLPWIDVPVLPLEKRVEFARHAILSALT